ncbi:MAG TPA: hypothetical protein VGI12_07530 [Vicinamibacterales bacterium]|jgi:hypothetical protein
MVKKLLFACVLLAGFVATPRPAIAGCTTDLGDCYGRAARVDSFWYRWATGLDCELDYTQCVRIKLVGA